MRRSRVRAAIPLCRFIQGCVGMSEISGGFVLTARWVVLACIHEVASQMAKRILLIAMFRSIQRNYKYACILEMDISLTRERSHSSMALTQLNSDQGSRGYIAEQCDAIMIDGVRGCNGNVSIDLYK